MLDVIKMIKPKQKPPPVKEEPKPEPKKFPIALPQSTKGKVLAGVVALHVVFLLYFIWFLITASITETESEVASIMRGEVEMKIDKAYTPANISTLLHFIFIDPNSKHKIYNLWMLIKLQLTPATFSPSTARKSILVINNIFFFAGWDHKNYPADDFHCPFCSQLHRILVSNFGVFPLICAPLNVCKLTKRTE